MQLSGTLTDASWNSVASAGPTHEGGKVMRIMRVLLPLLAFVVLPWSAVGQVSTGTVTGGSPVVDVQHSRSQSVISRALLDSVPLGSSVAGVQALTVGALGGLTTPTSGRDVGGSKGDAYTGALNIHNNGDGKLTV